MFMQGTNLNNVGSMVPQQLRIGGAPLQPNFPRSIFVQGTNGNNVGNKVFQVPPQQPTLMSQPRKNTFSNTRDQYVASQSLMKMFL
jgi:hypothetical protein